MSTHRHPRFTIARFCVALAGIAAATQGVRAAREPMAEALQAQVVAPAGFVATVAPVELSKVQDEVPAETLAAVSAFEAEAGPGWRFYVDRRSGGMALVEGGGIPWIDAGAGTLAELDPLCRGFVRRYPACSRSPSPSSSSTRAAP